MTLGLSKTNRGFTLIELLVVIAIIGILSAVVLASLNTARSRASDAAVRSNLANARSEAELFNAVNNTYTGVCSATATNGIGDNFAAALAAGGGTINTSGNYCNSDATRWAASAALKSGGNWCVDSTGASKSASLTSASVYACP